jgi:transcriptional regulator with XRE-family HTH domain
VLDYYEKLIGHRIRQRRIDCGFKNQEELAAKLGADQSRVSRWESGQALPDKKYRPALLQVLKTSEQDLFGFTEENSRPSSQAKLSPSQMKHLIEESAANLQHRPLALVLERFVSESPDVRAATLAILYKDETISLPYLRPGSAPSKPSQAK